MVSMVNHVWFSVVSIVTHVLLSMVPMVTHFLLSMVSMMTQFMTTLSHVFFTNVSMVIMTLYAGEACHSLCARRIPGDKSDALLPW